jgi:hypothetical protein
MRRFSPRRGQARIAAQAAREGSRAASVADQRRGRRLKRIPEPDFTLERVQRILCAYRVRLYSRPFSRREVYSLEKGACMDVPLSYTSESGRLLAEEKRI